VNGGADFTSDGVEYLYVTGATVKSVRPSRAIAGVHGQEVTVVGEHFQPSHELSCRFGDARSPALFLSASLVACTAPPRDAGSLLVSVSTNVFDFSDSTALFILAPGSSAQSIGTVIRVFGVSASLADIHESALLCMFGDGVHVPANIDGDDVECAAPVAATSGTVRVKLTDVAGVDVTGSSFEFEYYPSPYVLYLSPSRGSVSGGMVVSVFGSGFMDRGLECRFGSQSGPTNSAEFISASLVTCTAPAWTVPGWVRVEVSVNSADFTASGTGYTYDLDPLIESLLPSIGTAGFRGQVVTVVGRHFTAVEGLNCRFGAGGSVAGLVLSSSLIACVVPERSVGTVSVSISTNGVERSFSAGQYVYSAERQ
ncbi:hypothetical protein T484DRAFT_1870433, partial [Baffinella frigidus]